MNHPKYNQTNKNKSLNNPSKPSFYKNFKLTLHLGKLQAINQECFSHARAYLKIQKQKYYFENIPQFRNNIANFQCTLQYDRISLTYNSNLHQYEEKIIKIVFQLQVYDKFMQVGEVQVNLGKTLNFYNQNRQKPQFFIYSLQNCYDKTAKVGIMLVFNKLQQNTSQRTNKKYVLNKYQSVQNKNNNRNNSKQPEKKHYDNCFSHKAMSEICFKQSSNKQQIYEISRKDQNNLKYIQTQRPTKGTSNNLYTQYRQNFQKSKNMNLDSLNLSIKSQTKLESNFQIDIQGEKTSQNKQVWQQATQKREYIQVDTEYINQLQTQIANLNQQLQQCKIQNQRYWTRLQQEEQIKQEQRILIQKLKNQIKQSQEQIQEFQKNIQQKQKKKYEENINQIKLKNEYLQEKLQQITIQSSTLRQQYEEMQIHLQNMQKYKNQSESHLKNQLEKYRQKFKQSQQARNKNLLQVQEKYKNYLQMTVKQHISQQKTSHTQYQKEIATLTEVVQALKIQNLKLVEELQESKKQKFKKGEQSQNLKKSIQALKVEITNYSNQLQMVQTLYKEQSKQNQKNFQKLRQKQKNNNDLNQQLIVAQKANYEMQQLLKMQKKTNQQIILLNETLQNQIRQLQSDNQQFIYEEQFLKQQKQKIERQLQYFKNQSVLANDEIQLLQNQLQQVSQSKQLLQKQFQNLKQHSMQLQQQIFHISQQKIVLNQKLRSYLQNPNYKKMHKKSQQYGPQAYQVFSQELYNKSEVQNLLTKKQIQTKMVIQNDWRIKVQELQEFFKKMKTKYAQVIEKQKKTHQNVLTQLSQTKTDLQKQKSLLKQSQTKNNQNINKIEIMKMEKLNFQSKIKNAQQKIQQFTLQSNKNNQKIEITSLNLEKSQDEVSQLQKELKKATQKYQDLTKKLKGCQNSRQAQLIKHRKSLQQIDNLKLKLKKIATYYKNIIQKVVSFIEKRTNGTPNFSFKQTWFQLNQDNSNEQNYGSNILQRLNNTIIELHNNYSQIIQQKKRLQKQHAKCLRQIQLFKKYQQSSQIMNANSIPAQQNFSLDDSFIFQSNYSTIKIKPHSLIKQNTKNLICEMQNQTQRVLFEYKQKIKKQKVQIQSKKNSLQQNKFVIKQLQKKVDQLQYQKRKHTENIQKIQEKYKQIELKYQKSQMKCADLTKEIANLQTQIHSIKNQKQSLEKYKHQNSTRQQSQFGKNIYKMQPQAQKFKIDKQNLINELRQQQQKTVKQLQNLKQNNDILIQENQELTIRNKYLQVFQRKSNSNQIKYLNELEKIKNDHFRQHNSSLNKLTYLKQQLQQKTAFYQKQFAELRNQALLSQKNKLQLQNKLKIQRQTYKTLQKQIQKYKWIENEQKTKRQKVVSEESKSYEYESGLRQKNHHYEQTIKKISNQLKEEKDKLYSSNRKLQQMEILFKKSQLENQQKEEEYKWQISSLRQSYSDLEKALQEFMDRRYKIESEYNQLMLKYQKLQKEHQQLRFSANSRQLQLQNTIEDLQNNIVTHKPASPILALTESLEYRLMDHQNSSKKRMFQYSSLYMNKKQSRQVNSRQNTNSKINMVVKKQKAMFESHDNYQKEQQTDNIFGSKFTFNSD